MEECFALHDKMGCSVLDGGDCNGCPFHKTRSQLEREKRKSAQRLMLVGMLDYARLKYGSKLYRL